MDRCISSLTTNRQKLLQAMQRNPFSTIDIIIKGGEPSFGPPPKITREIKLGLEASPRPLPDRDFALKRAVNELFEHFEQLRDGSVVTIEIRHGLPARLIVAGEV